MSPPTTDLEWRDLRELATLAAEKADDRALPMLERDEWGDLAMRMMDGHATAQDYRRAGELSEIDAALQPDRKVRQRYLDLAQRAFAKARST